ncbi:b-box zinc finger domain-containing protein [Ditylenchus destructor]|uniref:B-box zinc finger domain-containing protein n=1 Tax=Ditylenchus destructor TaxID=166010 RepID=A0AAD4RAM1_9BILA|nr:b-box zinc finger domain-containing protein [Ditylenchus destructor]
MEEELKCPACRQFLRDPLLLQCAHSYCRDCALAAQVKITSSNALSVNNMSSGINPTSNYANFSPLSPPCSSNSGASMSSDTISLCVSDADQESFDKMSVVSETDSGVVICGIGSGPGSRPNSFLSSGGGISPTVPPQRSVPSILSSPNPTSTAHHAGCYVLICEACHKPTYLADNTVLKNARENMAIRRLLAKYKAGKGEAAAKNISALSNCNQTEVPNCQWCESQQPSRAELFCVECGYYYCPACQPVIHPARGPLKDHKLVTASNAAAASGNNHTLGRRMSICSTTASTSNLWKASTIELADNSQDGSESSSQTCEVHSAEPLSMYCVICRVAVCCQCLMSRHANHQVQSLSTAAKTQKARQQKAVAYQFCALAQRQGRNGPMIFPGARV